MNKMRYTSSPPELLFPTFELVGPTTSPTSLPITGPEPWLRVETFDEVDTGNWAGGGFLRLKLWVDEIGTAIFLVEKKKSLLTSELNP